ncbi:hypothetical protein [Algoriphagus machipongonensis]|uniref:Secretion system C-terminal sorting domain-containing protein n=1 Tax=Algoriphagus machipongonensis TaxID=388413 RepID=A3HRZ1_9BACT|nr:hypothetical protein [Algoriphagus machipongonensis]EAZ82609.1 hypothetical protein ALPR1_10350 [Algoriphagus machipongonensis]
MKTLFTLAICCSLSLSAIAAEDLKELSSVNTIFQKVKVSLKSGVGDAKIFIMDMNGKKLCKRKVHVEDSNVVVPYDMGHMPEGDYLVKISTDDEEVIYEFNTKARPKKAESLPLMAYGKTVNDATVSLSVIGLTVPGVNVKIFSAENGKLIYEEYISEPEAFKKDFALKGVQSDDIYMEVNDAQGRKRTLFF